MNQTNKKKKPIFLFLHILYLQPFSTIQETPKTLDRSNPPSFVILGGGNWNSRSPLLKFEIKIDFFHWELLLLISIAGSRVFLGVWNWIFSYLLLKFEKKVIFFIGLFRFFELKFLGFIFWGFEMGSRKEEEKIEKIIRGLMKLPPNRRCINCNSLVNITFFICKFWFSVLWFEFWSFDFVWVCYCFWGCCVIWLINSKVKWGLVNDN